MSLTNRSLLLLLSLALVEAVVAYTQATNNARSLTASETNVLETESAKATKPMATNLGGEALNKPCCVSWGPGRVDCFIRSAKSNVLHKTIMTSGSICHSPWTNLGGFALDGIECVSRGWGLIDLIVVSRDSQLYTNSFVYGVWTGWSVRPTTLAAEVPSCIARSPTIVTCLYRNVENKGFAISLISGKWGEPYTVGGILRSPLACSSGINTAFNCFAVGVNDDLSVRAWAGKWIAWVDLGGSLKGRPSVITWDKNRIDVFVLGTQNDVRVKTWNGSQWLDWISLGGVFDSDPECVTTGVGKIHCFIIGPRSWLYRNSLTDDEWSGWTAERVGFDIFLETPSCVVSGKDEVACYLRDSTRGIIQIFYRF